MVKGKKPEKNSNKTDFLKYEVSQEMGLGRKSKKQESKKDI